MPFLVDCSQLSTFARRLQAAYVALSMYRVWALTMLATGRHHCSTKCRTPGKPWRRWQSDTMVADSPELTNAATGQLLQGAPGLWCAASLYLYLYLKVTVKALGSGKRPGSYNSRHGPGQQRKVETALARIQHLTGPCAVPFVCGYTRLHGHPLQSANAPIERQPTRCVHICDDLRLPLKGTSPRPDHMKGNEAFFERLLLPIDPALLTHESRLQAMKWPAIL